MKEHTSLYAPWNIIYNNQDMEATQVPTDRWLGREDVVHIHNGILLGHKKDELLPFATAWVDLEGNMLSETSQIEKINIMFLLICGI